MTKPFTMKEVYRTLDSVLEQKRLKWQGEKP
jgi:hypothetical protein